MSKIAYNSQDNWKNFSYESRYLDALAGLFQVQGDCGAVVKYENILYLSYNSNITVPNKNVVKFIQHALQNIGEGGYKPEDLLGIYLMYNTDFIELVKKTRNHVPTDTTRDFLENFINTRASIKSKLDSMIKKNLLDLSSLEVEDLRETYLSGIVKNYKDVLNAFSKNKELNNHLNTFLRPMQDTYKLHNFLQEPNYKDIKILDNTNALHAEYNIANQFPYPEYLMPNYIGISKLCCGYCHKYLEDKKYAHRGTHGLCDDKWKLASPQEKQFKDSVESIKPFDQSNLPMQARKLSRDDIEQELISDNVNMLYDMKIYLEPIVPNYISYYKVLGDVDPSITI